MLTQTVNIPSFADIQSAHKNITPYIHHTPVLTNKQLDERAGCSVFLKCENFQKVGAFKFRGACNTVLLLSAAEAQKGVATHSSGNHAQAIARAAQMRGIPAYVVMPENAPDIKKRAVREYGAEITFCAPSIEARESTLAKVVERTGANFIHPHNQAEIIAGQGTAALELLEDQGGLDMILTPVGGGGILSGTAIAAASLKPEVQVIGCEPKLADDAFRSFESGRLQPVYNTDTIADGLRTSLGELSFSCIQEYVHQIVTVSEKEIIEAMRFVWERMNIIIEASSAVPVAAILNNKIATRGKQVGIIITGGNVDLDNLPWHV